MKSNKAKEIKEEPIRIDTPNSIYFAVNASLFAEKTNQIHYYRNYPNNWLIYNKSDFNINNPIKEIKGENGNFYFGYTNKDGKYKTAKSTSIEKILNFLTEKKKEEIPKKSVEKNKTINSKTEPSFDEEI